MKLPKEIRVALKSKKPTIYEWVSLLNFFKEYQRELSRGQKINIYKRCEVIRQFWNTLREETFTFTKASGRLAKSTKYISPLNIEIKNINPNNIYTDKDIAKYLDKNQTRFQSTF